MTKIYAVRFNFQEQYDSFIEEMGGTENVYRYDEELADPEMDIVIHPVIGGISGDEIVIPEVTEEQKKILQKYIK